MTVGRPEPERRGEPAAGGGAQAAVVPVRVHHAQRARRAARRARPRHTDVSTHQLYDGRKLDLNYLYEIGGPSESVFKKN